MKFDRLLIFFNKEDQLERDIIRQSQLKCVEKNFKGEYFYFPQFFLINNS